ncbi:hypothetical protein [Streptomyces celluloflavus]|uniref:hypothetical protein n=1 Tax=Streptomyces celluloflavus TaxID=58344 RepID=UPI0036D01445
MADQLQEYRNHSDALSLIFAGERPLRKSGEEILEIARSADFYEEGRVVEEYENGSIEYVPRTMSENALFELLSIGRLQYKFKVDGTPVTEHRNLGAGTYYYYIDFAEGPDFDQGRWIGRIIDENGAEVGVRFGVEIKILLSFHAGDEHMREEHQRPRMHLHGVGTGAVAESIRAVTGSDWRESVSDWVSLGGGRCARIVSCDPPQ